MEETNTQMRRSFSMPVKPLYLEQKTLKRSTEKETVYATDESDGDDDNLDTNYRRQGSSPAIVANNLTEPTTLRGLPKHIRSVRDFLANTVNPIFSIFRKSNTRNDDKIHVQETSSIKTIERNGECLNLNADLPIEESSEQNSKTLNDLEKKNNESPHERVVFSL